MPWHVWPPPASNPYCHEHGIIPRRLVIVGGVADGANAAARARRLCEQCEITLFERDSHASLPTARSIDPAATASIIHRPGCADLQRSRRGLAFAMKIASLPVVLAAWMALNGAFSATANPTAVRSPETAQTYADSSILWHQLRWLPGPQMLVASITFSNLNYASKDEPRQDERFDFSLPGVKFEARDGTYYVFGAHGERIGVATLQRQLIGRSIVLLPGAQMNVFKRSGLIHVVLVAGETPIAGSHWVEK